MGDTTSCAIIGAGAAGMTAAISCRRRGGKVLLLERLSKPGKKILASGGGRCNLLNERLDADCYNAAARDLVGSVFSLYGKDRLLEFLAGLGIRVFLDGNRLFPVTNQAATVVRAFELQLQKLALPVHYNFEAVSIAHAGSGYVVKSSGGASVECATVIVAGGGRSYPALGSNGSCFRLAQGLGHRIIEPVPSCVALVCHDKLCHHLQGQRISSRVRCLVDNQVAAESDGELIFTQYGLSGTAVLDVSVEASLALNRRKRADVFLSVDMLPFMAEAELAEELSGRYRSGMAAVDVLTGLLPNKFGPALADLLRSANPAKIAGQLKGRRFEVAATRGWNEAEFTRGGVDTAQVCVKTCESKLRPGTFFCGEVLDVDGKRGGYNLAWAWASGLAAGEAVVST